MTDILIVPDPHLRSFWRKVVNSNLPVVFLGDYVDPYRDSSFEAGWKEFEDIIEFAKERPDNVTLLLGDHEGQYVGLSNSLARFDFGRSHYIFNFLKENESLFTGAFIYNNALFTHAGISKGWLKSWNLPENPEMIKNYINNHIKFSEHFVQPSYYEFDYFNNPCFDIGGSRGGNAIYGGPFWTDVEEMVYFSSAAFKGQINQIFAHSQLKDTGTFIHLDNWWMCDSRAVFIWDGKELKLYN